MASGLQARLVYEGQEIGEETGGMDLEVNPLTGPIPVETEDFVGRLLLLQRPDPEPEEWTYKELFRGKLRNVQFRLQGRFKTEPGKEMFMSIQAPREVLLDSIRKKAASLSLNFINKMVQRTGGELNYNVDWKKFPDSDILQPHLTMPLCSLDVLIQTPHGEEPPSLTTPMERVPQAVKKAVSFNSTDTYTIMWWSKYVDLFRWRRINFPLGLNGTLEPYLGREVHVCIFRLPLEDELKAMEADGLPPPNDPLCESQKLTYLRLKVSHSALTEEEFEECVDWDEVEEDLDWDASAREKGA